MSLPRVRPATERDLAAINEIYNHYVLHTAITFDVEPWSLERRRAWLAERGVAGAHRALVAEAEGRVAGFASSGRFRPKPAYATSVETSVYVAPGLEGRGLGSALYAALFDALRGEAVHRAIAGVTLPNPASLALHARFGFRPVGTMHEVGRKLGRYWSVQWFEKELP